MFRRAPLMSGLLLAPVLALLVPADVPTIQLTKPAAELEDTFDHPISVLELGGGRLVVTDLMGPTVELVDMARGTRTAIGRKGQGPNEYMFPERTLALPGDSAAVVDLGQHRFLRITPAGAPAGTFVFPEAAAMGSQFRASDRQGRIYYLGSRYTERGERTQIKSGSDPFAGARDSAPLLRWDRVKNRIDTLTRIGQPSLAKPSEGKSAGNRMIMSRPQPFAAEDDWAVLPDGRVAILRAADYHIEWIAPDGRRTVGKPIPFTRERVTRADKDDMLKPAQAVTSNGGKFSMPALEESDFVWPEFKPPFVPRFTFATPEGHLWVQRWVAAGAAPLYDEFDERGELVRHIGLMKKTRIVGFGKGVVYTTRSDEDDLLHLQRFAR